MRHTIKSLWHIKKCHGNTFAFFQVAIPFIEVSGQNIGGRWLGQESKLSVSENIVRVEMLGGQSHEWPFQEVLSRWVEERWVCNWRQREGRQTWSTPLSMRMVIPSTPAADVLLSFLIKEWISSLKLLQGEIEEEQLNSRGEVSGASVIKVVRRIGKRSERYQQRW